MTDTEKAAALAKAKSNPETMLSVLQAAIKRSTDSQAMMRVNSHIRAKTGGKHTNIVHYHNNGASAVEKCELYNELATAVRDGDYTKLLGAVPSGQAAAPETVNVTVEEPKQDEPRAVEKPVEVVQPRTFTPDMDRAKAVESLLAIIGGGTKATVDPDEVAKIARGIMESEGKVMRNDLQTDLINWQVKTGQRVDNIVNDYLAKIPPRDVVEIRKVNEPAREVARQHYKFALLLACLSQGLHVAIVGPAGSGKTSAAHVAAEALKLQFGAMSVGPMTSKSDILGYMDAEGRYRSTEVVRCATEGGVMLLDEMDAANPGVLTYTNAILANGVFGTPDGMKTKHKDFVMIAGMNTYGMGANRVYVGRNQLDGATLDRFVVIDWDYDRGFEASLVGVTMDSPRLELGEGGTMTNEAWISHVLKVREACERLAIRHVVSPRATIYGCKLFAAGVGRVHVEQMVLWKGLDVATVNKIKEAL